MRPRKPPRCPIALWLTGLSCLVGPTQGQTLRPEAPEPSLQLAQAEVERRIFIGEGPAGLAGAEPGPERVVKGAPYCADATHETVQWLADGAGGAPNRITRQNSTRLCRDGEGRTRQEFDRNGHKVVYLRDPLSRESWVLDLERKTARRMGDGRTGAFETAAWRDYSERMREWARSVADRARAGAGTLPPTPPAPPAPPAPPVPPVPPTPVVINTDEVGADGQRRVEVRIVRVQPGAEPGVPADSPTPPPAVQWRSQVLAPRGAGTVTPLPARDIEGLRAHGERTTWVIEAGKVGNDKPIQVTREVWTSPDLMLTVLSRDFDPRSGEVNYRLKNLKRGEPDAALMRVPADFSKPPRPAPRASGPTG